ncbi:type I polyketide synthase [Kibdelosporangium philippinense]|uniref:Type I polyketide synthase n=2 Tax=Kibdelosporangium philippinense TaxID=211113 RepID=A0ABS8ZFT6_9PSEU|nr:type I polyketide synthase [Kibdelosporangium philippinense]MCE7006392.1 type I polyketide synthase [Kibdelosporangium philippinense]
MGLRLPGGVSGPTSFWRLLRDGTDVVTDVPPDRWRVADHYDADPAAPGRTISRWGGFLADIATFDASYFGISRREALRMDPQQRLLLEVTQEALDDAGMPRERLEGTNTGVFAGIGHPEYSWTNYRLPELANPFTATGSFPAVAANRISYAYDLHGPSYAVEAVCSSALLAFHLACQSIQHGECDQAIVGGANLALTPDMFVWFAKLGVMSPTGRCHPFDAAADGIVFGEGVVSFLLRPLSVALAEGDQVYAVVRGGAVAHEGRTNGLTAPGREGQERLLRKAYEAAGVAPGQVHYVEAHGTGTPVGDPIEVHALGAVVGQGRQPGNPCFVGSLKSNIGHLGMVAGLAGVAKTALALRHRQLPPSLHYTRENPLLGMAEANLAVVDRLTPLPAGQRGLAGVTSLSFGGTDVHVVLEEADPVPQRTASLPVGEPHLLVMSAHGDAALRQTAGRFAAVAANSANSSFADMCYTATVRRGHHTHRAAVVAHSATAAAELLTRFAAGDTDADVMSGRAHAMRPTEVAFVFSGARSTWTGMAPRLARLSPAFREELDACDRLMRPLLGYSPAEALWREDSTADEGRWRPELFAVQASLAAMWRAVGIEPRCAVGYGIGEITAEYVAGTRTREEAVAAVCAGDEEPDDDPARFAQALERSRALGCDVYLDFTPDAELAAHLGPHGERHTVLASARRGAEARTWMASLGRLYCMGAPVQWDALYPSGNLVPLPSQAWQRERYWLHDEAAPDQFRSQPDTPSTPAPDAPRTWRIDLDEPDALPLREHGAAEIAVVPAAAYLALAHRAAGEPFVVTDFVINRARPLPDTGAGSLVLTLSEDDTGTTVFRFDADLHAGTAGSTPLAQGRLAGSDSTPRRGPVPAPGTTAAGLVEILDGAHDEAMRLRGARYGSVYRTVTQVRRQDGSAAGTVRVDLTGAEWIVAASVLDGCLQIAYQALPANDFGARMPSRIGRLRLHRHLTTGTYHVHAKVGPGSAPVGQDVAVDLDVRSEAGDLVAEIDGLVLRSVPGRTADITVREHRWRQVEPPNEVAAAPAATWVVYAGDSEDGDQIAARLQAVGHQVSIVRTGASLTRTQDGWQAPPTAEGFAGLAREPGGEIAGIVYLRTARLCATDSPAAAAAATVEEVIALVAAWTEQGVPRLLLTTRGGGMLDGDKCGTEDLASAPLAAVARTIRIEHPGSQCVLVDLDPAGGGTEQFVSPLGWAQPEPVMALRSGRWYVPRLVPVSPVPPDPDPRAPAEMTCLITGGLGHLGLLVAQRLLARGVRRLALAGRHAPTAETRHRLSVLDPAGDRISVHQLDVADPDQVRAVIDELNRTGPAVGGVVHAAAVLDDGVLTAMNSQRLMTTMAPKALGAWHLHAATTGDDLRFFVLFSSVASVLGSPGQVNYVAANAFLDALAHHRKAAGKPAISINWGPWQDSGQAGARGSRHWAARGVDTMSEQESLRAFDSLLDGVGVQFAVFRDLASSSPTVSSVPDQDLSEDVAELEEWLLDQIALLLGDDAGRLDTQTPFQELGLDSLMSLELQNRIESRFDTKVPSTVLWRYPDVASLAAHLAEKVAGRTAAAAGAIQ